MSEPDDKVTHGMETVGPDGVLHEFHPGPPLAPQEPPADTIQAVRELYRDDRDAMAQAIFSLRADLAEARRER